MKGSRITLIAVAAALAAQPLRSQAPSAVPRSVGVLLIAHGANAGWNSKVDSLAAAVTRSGRVGGPVRVSFLMGATAAERPFQKEIDSLVARGATRVVVVPVLVSSRSGHYEQIRYVAGAVDTLSEVMQHHLHMSGITRSKAGVPIVVTPALDDAAELAEVVAARALALVPSPARRALFLLGHGPNSAEDYAGWMAALRPVAETVRARTGFASVAVELVRDDAPAPVRAEAVLRSRELIGMQYAATGQDVAVVPLLISSGGMTSATLPKDLAGLPIVYAGAPLLNHEALVRWVERRVADAVAGTAVK